MTIGLSKVEAVLVEWWVRSQIGVKGMGCQDIKTISEDSYFCLSSYDNERNIWNQGELFMSALDF